MSTQIKSYPQVDKKPLELVVSERIPRHILKKWQASKSIAEEDFSFDKVKRAEDNISKKVVERIEKA
jgi:hypothetical protein